MEHSRVNIKLHRIPERIAKEEGYAAIVSSSETVSFVEFAKEAIEQNGFRMTPRMMQIYLEARNTSAPALRNKGKYDIITAILGPFVGATTGGNNSNDERKAT